MDANQQAKELFDRFRELHGNSTEQFAPTLDNILRWRWAVNEAEKRNDSETMPFKRKGKVRAKQLADTRATRVFDRLPTSMKEKFLYLSSIFPGRKVYACGSRITGEYVEKDSPSGILEMRKALLKKEAIESDYDIVLDFVETDKVADLRKLLPPWGDLVANLPADEPKVLIPMWDFTKLPRELHNEVVDLVEQKQWGKLMAIHNDYGLTSAFFCCDSKPAERWFTWAVEHKIIQRNDTQEAAQ